MSKYIKTMPSITVYDHNGYGNTVDEDLAIDVARAMVALDNAERKFAKTIDRARYPYDIG